LSFVFAEIPKLRPYTLLIHGGAGNITELSAERERLLYTGLEEAFAAGEQVLEDGGSALDAVCAAVCIMEENEGFNCGRGATLNAEAVVEHDAAVMFEGHSGAICGSTHAKHPVLFARAVLERSPHVFLAMPPDSLLEEWGLERVPNDYFVTAERAEQLKRVQAAEAIAEPHGTVGAVAIDRNGHLAAATSTGGMENKKHGRVGDSPIIGAGTWAADGERGVAISATGWGEMFIEGAVAHEIQARVRYHGQPLAAAGEGTLTDEVGTRGGYGGVIIMGSDGRAAAAWNSTHMISAWRDESGVHTQLA
jgi:beta-aspartyl-peptidase (threonine type)